MVLIVIAVVVVDVVLLATPIAARLASDAPELAIVAAQDALQLAALAAVHLAKEQRNFHLKKKKKNKGRYFNKYLPFSF